MTVADHKPGPGGFAVPKGQDEVGIFNDGEVSLERGGPPVPLVVRQILGQLQPMGLGVLPGGGVHLM